MPAWLAFVLIVTALLLVAWAGAAWPWKRLPRRWRQEHGLLYLIGLMLLVGGAVIVLLGVWSDAGANLGAEAVGIGLTVLLIDYFVRKRDELLDKRYWIRELGADVASETRRAIRELKYQGWLSDGSLKKADLWGANLVGVDLSKANLKGATLREANLEGANLQEANLEGAYLRKANLKEAILLGANLEGAYLREANLKRAHLGAATGAGAANLKGAILREANLEGAYLWGCNLKGANLRQARGLTRRQIDSARGDAETELPTGFDPPGSWKQRSE